MFLVVVNIKDVNHRISTHGIYLFGAIFFSEVHHMNISRQRRVIEGIEVDSLLKDLYFTQAYWGKLTLLVSKNAGIRDALVSVKPRAFPVAYRESDWLSQKLLDRWR